MTAVAKARKQANVALYDLTLNTYFPSVPLDKLYAAVESAGYEIPEGERAFMVCGHEGRANVPLRHLDMETWRANDAAARLGGWSSPHVIPQEGALTFTWYRMPSGRFEVVAYVS